MSLRLLPNVASHGEGWGRTMDPSMALYTVNEAIIASADSPEVTHQGAVWSEDPNLWLLCCSSLHGTPRSDRHDFDR